MVDKSLFELVVGSLLHEVVAGGTHLDVGLGAGLHVLGPLRLAHLGHLGLHLLRLLGTILLLGHLEELLLGGVHLHEFHPMAHARENLPRARVAQQHVSGRPLVALDVQQEVVAVHWRVLRDRQHLQLVLVMVRLLPID